MIYSRKSIIRKTRQKKTVEKGRLFARKMGFIFVGLLFITGILAWQSGNEKALISEINISGNEVTNEKDIRKITQREMSGKYGWLFHRDNIFIYPKRNIEKELFALDKRIQEINIYRDSLTGIAIEVSERKPRYVWCESAHEEEVADNCFFLDDEGYIFAKAPQFSGSVFFEFYGTRDFADNPLGNTFFEKSEFEKFVALKNEMERFNFEPVAFMEKEKGDFNILLKDGVNIMFNKNQDIDVQLENLNSVAETINSSNKQLEYVDLRFGNKVFYKFK
ncbi:cell division protein FtsQ/DivIB [Patescibacteria group bacterium]